MLCHPRDTGARRSHPAPRARDVARHPLVCRRTDKRTPHSCAARVPAPAPPHGPNLDSRRPQRILSGVVGLELVASEIVTLSGVATRDYGPGERLGGDTTERLKELHVYIRNGAIALRVAAGGSTSALVEVCGAGRLLPPQLWETKPGLESPYAIALVATTTLELPAELFAARAALWCARLGAGHPPRGRSRAHRRVRQPEPPDHQPPAAATRTGRRRGIAAARRGCAGPRGAARRGRGAPLPRSLTYPLVAGATQNSPGAS